MKQRNLIEILEDQAKEIRRLKAALARIATPPALPAGFVELATTNELVTTVTNNVLSWNAVVSDNEGWFGSGTNIVPLVAGRYQVFLRVDATQSWAGARIIVGILKNGVLTGWDIDCSPGPSTAAGHGYFVAGELDMNGTTDTISVRVFNGMGSDRLVDALIVVRLIEVA